MEDQGSGVLVDLAQWGLPHEPTVAESVAAGADVVTFSGDKLLGGPQAGIIAGRYHVVAALKKHPLARAVRLDKMTLAALETTLRLYLDPAKAMERIPTLRMLAATATEMAGRAARLADEISRTCGECFLTGTHDDVSRAGGGALPMADIPTVCVAVTSDRFSVTDLEVRLRTGAPHIVARIADDKLLLDPRTLTPADEAQIVAAFSRIASEA
jgi:L-seryl-tRNA(Ser) seleniumtransferase